MEIFLMFSPIWKLFMGPAHAFSILAEFIAVIYLKNNWGYICAGRLLNRSIKYAHFYVQNWYDFHTDLFDGKTKWSEYSHFKELSWGMIEWNDSFRFCWIWFLRFPFLKKLSSSLRVLMFSLYYMQLIRGTPEFILLYYRR